MQLRDLQQQLQRIYEIDLEHDVHDFLTTNARVGAQVHPRSAREKLIVVQDGEDLDLALYLDREVVRSLGENDPRASLDHLNLHDFLTALEGVSHFLYLAWKAGHGTPVSLLEMELQAEVDKYITSAVWMSRQRRLDPGALRRALFANPRYLADLDRAEHTRYRQANDLADAYCRQLEDYYRHDFGGLRMFNDLRRFYRLPQAGKIRHIGVMN